MVTGTEYQADHRPSTKNEVGRYPYSNLKLEIINIPMAVLPKEQRSIVPDSEDTYVKLLDNPKVISEVFHLLSEKVPTIIHCDLGRDRTAIIVALVELVLGLTENDIKRDFAASNMDLERNQFDTFLATIRKLGGVEHTLDLLGVKHQDITKVREWLSPKKMNSDPAENSGIT